MKKILITTDNFYPRIDGISRFLFEIISRLQFDFKITVICPKFKGEEPEFDNVTIYRMPLSGKKAGDLELAKPNKFKIRELVEDTDLVWNQTLGPIGYYAIKYAKRFNKTLASYNHSIEWELFSYGIGKANLRGIVNYITKFFMRRLYNKFDLLITPSIETGEILRKNGIRTPFKPVYLGVDSKKFLPNKKKMEAKEKIGVERTAFIIGYCGRIGREKDLKTLYRAFLRAKRTIKNLRLLIVGSGIKKEENAFKNKKGVLFMGQKQNVVPYLQAMDVFILPSLTETTSLATLEAMSCGLPVIVTPVGHLKEYISNNNNGIFFPFKDNYSLSRKIEKLYKDEKLRNKLSNNARKTVLERYSWAKTVKDIKNILENI